MWLITGATGLVGGILTRILPGPVVGMARRPMDCRGNIAWVQGDLSRDSLGLDPDVAERLRREVTGIVHCAAEVRFSLPLQQVRNINVAGTERLLDFARGCAKLRAFAHVSTVYVMGAEEGTLPEARTHATRWISSYEQSKYEAEELALEAARTLPVAVYRLSSIIGDAATGRVRQFNHVHQMLRLMPRKLLPAIPGDAEARMDLIPSDAALEALAHLIQTHCEPGSVWNVCSGEERCWTLGEIIEETVRAYHCHGHAICGPRLIRPDQFAALLTRFSGLTQDVATVASHFLPHLALRQSFACDRTNDVLAHAGLELPHISAYFAKVLGYCFASQWGNAPVNGHTLNGANGSGAPATSLEIISPEPRPS